MKKILYFAAVLTVALHAETSYQTLQYVIDGDTAQFSGMRCRFAYVDTPESGNNAKARRDSAQYHIPLEKIYDAGRLAKRYTKSRLQKGRRYRIDTVKKDRYGRNICTIYLGDGRTINDLLVSDGFAVPFWRYVPLAKKPHFVKLLYMAKKQHKGLWRVYPELMQKAAF